jgi:hypothetical protein
MQAFGPTTLNGDFACCRRRIAADAALISRYNARRHAQAVAEIDPQPSHLDTARRGRRTEPLFAFLVSFPFSSYCREPVLTQVTGVLPRT